MLLIGSFKYNIFNTYEYLGISHFFSDYKSDIVSKSFMNQIYEYNAKKSKKQESNFERLPQLSKISRRVEVNESSWLMLIF